MRIVLWHGYLLGGTGSNVYTRALAREWSRPVTTSSSCARSAIRSGTTSAERRSSGLTSAGCCRCSCSTATRGSRRSCCRISPRDERERYVELNAAAVREHLPGRRRVREPRAARAPVGAGAGVPFAVKAHGSELEYSMRGNEELSAWGRETLAMRGCVRRLGAHPQGARGGRRACRPRARGSARRRRRRSSGPSRASARSRICSRRRAPTRRIPATRTSGSRTKATPSGSPSSSRRRADGRLLREAALQQGRPRAAQGAARARCARESSSGSATIARRSRGGA